MTQLSDARMVVGLVAPSKAMVASANIEYPQEQNA